MAGPGRPTERPAHLSQEQRAQAQRQTAEWRSSAKLSQKEMAKRVGVGYSTYRMWESGRGENAGPTHSQAQQLNRALQGLLGEHYPDGRAFQVWGWPPEAEMSYSSVASLLRKSGFITPNQLSSRPSASLLVHRLREPNLIHGVFALAAAALTRADISVCLLLDDDLASNRRRQDIRGELEARIRAWFDFAAGNLSLLTIRLYSDILTQQELQRRGWSAVIDYLNAKTTVVEFLRSSKIVSPLQFSTSADQSVLELLRQEESLRAVRLIEPIRNWIVFEDEIARLSRGRKDAGPGSIVTLGGEDERTLWDIWHRGCPEELSANVQHIFLRPIPMPPYRVPWQERTLAAGADRPSLTAYLRNRTAQDSNADLLEWIQKSSIDLPAALNPGFHDSLPPGLIDHDSFVHYSAADLSSMAPVIAEAVLTWLNA